MFRSNSFSLVVFILFLVTLQLCTSVSAKPAYSLASKRSASHSSLSKSFELESSTNGKRMAAGLNPHSPTRPFNPSRVVAREPQASAISYSGHILARDASTGSEIGWFSASTNAGRIQMTNLGTALSMSMSFTSSYDLIGLGLSGFNEWRWLGAQGSALLGPTSTTLNGFVMSNFVPAYSGPSVVGHSAGGGSTETHIFRFNPTTKEITAVWLNPSLAVLDVYFYISSGSGLKLFYLASNPNLSPSQGVDRVRLYLESQPY